MTATKRQRKHIKPANAETYTHRWLQHKHIDVRNMYAQMAETYTHYT